MYNDKQITVIPIIENIKAFIKINMFGWNMCLLAVIGLTCTTPTNTTLSTFYILFIDMSNGSNLFCQLNYENKSKL